MYVCINFVFVQMNINILLKKQNNINLKLTQLTRDSGFEAWLINTNKRL